MTIRQPKGTKVGAGALVALALLSLTLPALAGGPGGAVPALRQQSARAPAPVRNAAAGFDWPEPDWNGTVLITGVSLSMATSELPDDGGFIRWESFDGSMAEDSVAVDDLSGSSLYRLGIGSPRSGSISLATRSGAGGAEAEGEVLFHPGLPDAASIYGHAFTPVHAGGGILQYAYSGTDTGSVFLALMTDGDRPAAAAYGAYADSSGFDLIGIGDLAAVETRSMRSELSLAGGRMSLMAPVESGSDWQVLAGFGVFFEALSWDSASRRALTMAPARVGPYAPPEIALEHYSSGSADYVGVMAGLEMRRRLADKLSLALSVSAGPALYEGQESELSLARFGDLGSTVFTGSETETAGAALQADAALALIFDLGPGVTLRTEAGLSSLTTLGGGARPLGRRTVVAPRIGVGLQVQF